MRSTGCLYPDSFTSSRDPLSVNYPWQFGMLQSSFIKREALLRLNCFPENLSQGEDRLDKSSRMPPWVRGGPGYSYKILSYVGISLLHP